jgi:SAM-dependent methyltransferase
MQPDWEQHYRDQFTPWDKGVPAPPLVDWLAAHPGEISGRVLVPGCGLGHDARAIAASHQDAEVVGLDLSPTAVAMAREIPPVNGERYKEGDLFDLPEGMLAAFDWVWEHTCFCAIDPTMREDYVRAVWTALRPGGQLLGVFYLDPYDDEHQPGGGPPHGSSQAELEERFVKSGRFEMVEQFVPANAYPGREGRELLVRMRRVG